MIVKMNCWKCRRQYAWPISRYPCCIFREGRGRELQKIVVTASYWIKNETWNLPVLKY